MWIVVTPSMFHDKCGVLAWDNTNVFENTAARFYDEDVVSVVSSGVLAL